MLNKISSLFLSIILILFLSGCSNSNTGQHSGDILANMSNIKVNNEILAGIYAYSLSTKDFTNVFEENDLIKGGIPEVIFNQDKSKILFNVTKETVQKGDPAIIEYDFNNKSFRVLVKHKDRSNSSLSNIQYVPNKNAITYQVGINLFYFDIISGEEIAITKSVGEYSWSKDGEHLIFCYTSNDKIYEYDMQTKKASELFEGYKPQFSKDNNYIAYLIDGKFEGEGASGNRGNDTLVVRELKTGREMKYQSKRISYFRFSPDDKYVAIMQFAGGFETQKIVAWDFKANKKSVILDKIPGMRPFDWK